MKSILLYTLLSGAGASFLWYAIGKFFPEDKKKAIGIKIGTFISRFGRAKFGTEFWEKSEDNIEKEGDSFWSWIKEGMNSDDNNREKK
jgi:hypothetical protein